MKKIAISLGALALCTSAAIAQDAGPDLAAGKALWEGNATQCKNCHGAKGEGGFGPDLAGRGLSGAEFAQAVRQPWGIMPAFIDSQVSDADLANMAAYFASLPKVGATGPWRVPVLPATPHGQQVAAAVGCAQCHGPTLDFPRGTLGATNGDITLLRNLVYAHTTAMPEVDEMLNPPQPRAAARPPQRLRMGNFNAMRVTDTQLQDIYDWLKNDVGFRPALQARLAADPSGSGAYTITLANNGLKDKGLTIQGLVIDMAVPAGTSVVKGGGPGYKGVHTDGQTKSDVAEWQVSRLAPKDMQTLTFVLSAAPANPADLKGTVHWAKPGPKSGPSTDVVNISGAPGGGAPAGGPPPGPVAPAGRRG